MDVKSVDFRFRLGPVQLFLLVFFLLPFGSANATGSIGRQVANFCSPAMTTPNVGSCSACHMTANESKNDLNAAGIQSRSGNFAFFCPAAPSTPPATPPATPGTGTGTAMGSGMTGMRGSRGMSSMRGMGSSRFRFRFRRGDDDDDDDDDDHDDDDRDDDDDD